VFLHAERHAADGGQRATPSKKTLDEK